MSQIAPIIGAVLVLVGTSGVSWTGSIHLVVKDRVQSCALAQSETLDGKGIEAWTFEESYLVASFARAVDALPLHPVRAGEWFKASRISNGSGGRLPIDLPDVRLVRLRR